MPNQLDLWEIPKEKEIHMIVGWRQWVDGGAISSGLPKYLINKLNARQIGKIEPDNFYIFQLPGLQQFIRPLVKHRDGLTKSVRNQKNEFYYTEVGDKGLVIFSGDEPHINAEKYTENLLSAAKLLNVKKIILLGGIYAEVPYDKDRFVTSIYSLPHLKNEVESLSVELSNYQGPGSIGSYVCNRAGKNNMEMIGLYSFCPIFHFSQFEGVSENIHIENDFMAWLGIMNRVNHMLDININLDDLEQKTENLTRKIHKSLTELDKKYPELEILNYSEKLSENFDETVFSPLGDIWQDEINKLGDDFFTSDE
jgi:proteasome assembly chaperone (PAC2) family protein